MSEPDAPDPSGADLEVLLLELVRDPYLSVGRVFQRVIQDLLLRTPGLPYWPIQGALRDFSRSP